MVKTVKKIGKNILKKLPLKYIIFESVPDLSDNTKYVFDEFIRRGLNKKYTFVWLVSDSSKTFPTYENVLYVDDVKDSKRLQYYKIRAKALVFCNGLMEKSNTKTKSFYLTHATQIKDSSSYYRAPQDIDYCVVTSKEFIEPMSKVYGIAKEKMLPLGFPRNDILFRNSTDIHKIWNNSFSRIIVWYPTFRQSKGGRVVEGCESMPIIHNEDHAVKINEILKKHNILIVLKPHFAQDISYIRELRLSNICIIDDSFFIKHNITSYEFVAGCDALLTDYSSIYFDYLACNKPIGAVWEDVEFYRQNRGFCMDIDYYMSGSEKIYTVEDFLCFIEHVAKGVDLVKKEREIIRRLVHDLDSGDSTKRVVDFIVGKVGGNEKDSVI